MKAPIRNHRFARREIKSLRERLLFVGMNDSQIAAHLQAAAAELITQFWASQLNDDDDDVEVTE